jgi:hypothetical protein
VCHRRVTQKRNLGKHMEKHKRDGTMLHDYDLKDLKLFF